ncbi:hypothetical protein CYLTODRAFT_488620 [Cylindrobasidium torrendii FP15055 ss-10]|uniref:Conidiation protein 6 n=1 Tax=Cylindrobasidium torrendii FP15055 ss-10 TaxID=1314674 RepID=A0A0D7BI86_9AGAR|nr:hypothetical protein CYLTODRAFT_488620 [Cylindrobasidium torrendii FP15055 ss-10]
MSSSTTHQKDPSHVAAGLKGALHNDNVSDEAKSNAAARLNDLEGSGEEPTNRSLGGYKATLTNDNVSPQAKKHAREVLEAAGLTVEPASEAERSEHEVRVLAGYKAALNNPRVSAEAKEHAREFLTAHNA